MRLLPHMSIRHLKHSLVIEGVVSFILVVVVFMNREHGGVQRQIEDSAAPAIAPFPLNLWVEATTLALGLFHSGRDQGQLIVLILKV